MDSITSRSSSTWQRATDIPHKNGSISPSSEYSAMLKDLCKGILPASDQDKGRFALEYCIFEANPSDDCLGDIFVDVKSFVFPSIKNELIAIPNIEYAIQRFCEFLGSRFKGERVIIERQALVELRTLMLKNLISSVSGNPNLVSVSFQGCGIAEINELLEPALMNTSIIELNFNDCLWVECSEWYEYGNAEAAQSENFKNLVEKLEKRQVSMRVNLKNCDILPMDVMQLLGCNQISSLTIQDNFKQKPGPFGIYFKLCEGNILSALQKNSSLKQFHFDWVNPDNERVCSEIMLRNRGHFFIPKMVPFKLGEVGNLPSELMKLIFFIGLATIRWP